MTRLRAVLLIVLSALAGPAVAQTTDRLPGFKLSGQAINVSIGVSGLVEMTVGSYNDEVLTASGEFDNQNLIGRFQAVGRQVACQPDRWCLQFQGMLLGLERAGMPKGTGATYVMTLTIPKNGAPADGVFEIGPLPKFDFSQYGVLRLNAVGE